MSGIVTAGEVAAAAGDAYGAYQGHQPTRLRLALR